MTLRLRPDVQEYIDEQVKAGRFATPEAVIEAAVCRFRTDDGIDDEPLDAETVRAIENGLAQAARGEGITLEAYRERMERRIRGGR